MVSEKHPPFPADFPCCFSVSFAVSRFYVTKIIIIIIIINNKKTICPYPLTVSSRLARMPSGFCPIDIIRHGP
jgi:hypothetical protein